MKRGFLFICFLSFVFLAAFSTCAVSCADIVMLKNGRSLEGEIIEESGTTMTLRTKIGKVVFKRADVASEERRELPEGFFGEKAEEKPQVTVNPVPLRAEGYGEASAANFNLSVSAEVKKLNNGDAILVKYTTNLPDKTVLYLTVKALGQELITRKQKVRGQSFAIRLGPFEEKRFSPGLYTVQVSCAVSRQESDEIKKQLGDIDDIVASAELRVGSPGESEQATGKRKKQLVSELKELGKLYNQMTAEYGSQKKKFDREKWDSLSESLKADLKAIKDVDSDYRKSVIVMDYAAQESMKMLIVSTLERMSILYTEKLYKKDGLAFTVPPSPDDRPADALNKVVQELFSNEKDFIEASEKVEGKG